MKYLHKAYKCIILALLMLALSSLSLLAAGTSFMPAADEDDLSDALTLISCSIQDGDNGIPINATIELEFSKNVVNIAVMKSNAACIHLIDDETGKGCKILITFPDDQMQRKYKREIFISPDPEKPLQPNHSYTLYIDNNLMSKNQTRIDNLHTISFTTGSQSTKAVNYKLAELGDNILLTGSNTGLTEYSVPLPTTLPMGEPTDQTDIFTDHARFALITAVSAGALGLLLITVLFIKKTSNSKA